jgi:hypothetical protein
MRGSLRKAQFSATIKIRIVPLCLAHKVVQIAEILRSDSAALDLS